MWIKYPIVLLLFFGLAVLQNSFLPYMGIMGITPNLLFIVFFLLVFFDMSGGYYDGIFYAVAAGFFLDILSPFYFGYSIISLLLIYFLVKVLFHYLGARREAHVIWFFAPLFLVSLAIYDALLFVLVNYAHLAPSFNLATLIFLGYNLAIACGAFFIYRTLGGYHASGRQLSLFR